jgi:threonine dehydrogenase-like Zn-dependent dehydrogenase
MSRKPRMWAHRLVAPGRFETVQADRPCGADLGPGQVLLRVLAGGICGSDMPKFLGLKNSSTIRDRQFTPGIAGFPMHEVVGEVAASRDAEITEGSRVVGWATASDGAAEYVVTDGAQLYAYDPSLPPHAAVLIQSLACVLYPLQSMRLTGIGAAVLGLGPIGLLFGHALKRAGCAHVAGVDMVDRSPVAAAFGFDSVAHNTTGSWSAGLGEGERPAVVVEAIGHQVSTLQHAIDACAAGGQILYFGIPDDGYYPLDMERMVRKNLTLTAGTTRRRREMLGMANGYLIAHPQLGDAIVTHTFDMSDIQQAFDLARVPGPGRLKIVLTVS